MTMTWVCSEFGPNDNPPIVNLLDCLYSGNASSRIPVEPTFTCLHRRGITSRRHAEMAICQHDIALPLSRIWSLRKHPTSSSLIRFALEVLVLESLNCLTAPPRHNLSPPICRKDSMPESPCPVFGQRLIFQNTKIPPSTSFCIGTP